MWDQGVGLKRKGEFTAVTAAVLMEDRGRAKLVYILVAANSGLRGSEKGPDDA